MALMEINWHPGEKELRQFGIVALIVTAAVSLVLYLLKGVDIKWCLPILAAGLVIFLASLISLRLTRLIYTGLMAVTFPIGATVSVILMAAFYFLLLTPLGLFFRLTGRDILGRKFDARRKSYWVDYKSDNNTERYFRQF